MSAKPEEANDFFDNPMNLLSKLVARSVVRHFERSDDLNVYRYPLDDGRVVVVTRNDANTWAALNRDLCD